MTTKDATRAVMVIGEGIAGIQASLDLADQGFKTYLVEKSARFGGYASEVPRTWEGEDVSAYVNGAKEKILGHPNIELLLSSKIVDVKGFVGNLTTTVEREKGRHRLSHGVIVLATGAPSQDRGISLRTNGPGDMLARTGSTLQKGTQALGAIGDRGTYSMCGVPRSRKALLLEGLLHRICKGSHLIEGKKAGTGSLHPLPRYENLWPKRIPLPEGP